MEAVGVGIVIFLLVAYAWNQLAVIFSRKYPRDRDSRGPRCLRMPPGE